MSSPTITGYSAIETEYQTTDQRRYFVPCPTCNEFQVLDFAQLVWEPGRPKTARYRCVACGSLIREAAKTRMLARGEWRATAPQTDPGVAGFHISALYCPVGWCSWAEIAGEAERAAQDPQKAQTFANTMLGESFALRGDAPDWHRLRERQTTDALGRIPPGPPYACLLTAGVDVQRDRIECSIWGWGRDRRSWLVDHLVLDGDVAADAVWERLSTLVSRTWPTPGELALPLQRVAIDTGFATTQVYAWARHQPAGRVVLVKGGPPGPALVSLPRSAEAVEQRGRPGRRRRARGLRVWQVNVHALKVETYGWLGLDAPAPGTTTPPGWISLPAVGDEFLRQLTAEQLVRKVVRGIERQEWVKVYNRNEALDCRIYARAAAHLVGLDRFSDADWTVLEAPFGPPEPPAPPSPPNPRAPQETVRRGGVPPAPPEPPARGPIRWRKSDFWR